MNLYNLINEKNKMDGLSLLSLLLEESIKVSFFDPQYRTILDKMNYGNEGKTKEKRRCNLKQMSEEQIITFIKEQARVLKKSGYMFFWVDKFILCEGINSWFNDTDLKIVDLIIWDKDKMGMGYRTRNQAEFLIILQKQPLKAKTTWTIHNIRNVWKEKREGNHPHIKPYNLQEQLILATTQENDLILDPCAGSFRILDICMKNKRNFIGCDIND